MKTFLKILVLTLVALVVIELFPLLMIPVVIALGAAIVAMAALAGGAAVVIAAVLALLVVLSPLWIPVLAVMGIIALCRRSPPKLA